MRPIRIVSLFSGMGQESLGYHLASGFEIVAAFDVWPRAVEIYNRNLPSPVARVADLKEMRVEDLPPHDLVIGGPPCQPYSLAGKQRGVEDPRDCIADFFRLAAGSAWVMENVRPLLPTLHGVHAPWSEQLCAADFGDCTSRRRWIYSNMLLHVMPVPADRRNTFGQIRDREADAAFLRRAAEGDPAPDVAYRGSRKGGCTLVDEGGTLPSMVAKTYNNVSRKEKAKRRHGDYAAMAERARERGFQPRLIEEDGQIGSLTAQSWHHLNSSACLVPVADEGVIGSLVTSSWHGDKRNGSGRMTAGSKVIVGQSEPTADGDVLGSPTSGHGGVSGFLRVQVPTVAMRGHGSDATPVEDEGALGSLTWAAYKNVTKHLGIRCPSLLEMARAHGIPDTWDWLGANKTERGKMIANGLPVGLGTAIALAVRYAMRGY